MVHDCDNVIIHICINGFTSLKFVGVCVHNYLNATLYAASSFINSYKASLCKIRGRLCTQYIPNCKQTDLIDFHSPDSEVGEGHHTGQRDHDTTAHLKRLVVLQGPITLTLFLQG